MKFKFNSNAIQIQFESNSIIRIQFEFNPISTTKLWWYLLLIAKEVMWALKANRRLFLMGRPIINSKFLNLYTSDRLAELDLQRLFILFLQLGNVHAFLSERLNCRFMSLTFGTCQLCNFALLIFFPTPHTGTVLI